MRAKTIVASLVTLSFMLGFVFATLAGVAIASQQVHVLAGIALGVAATIAWALLMWLLSPWIMDLIQSWIYSAKPITIEELAAWRPNVARFVHEVCARHRVRVPRLKLIDDGTPQAYCYGSYANNARLVVTRGLVDLLDDEELKGVYGHELGHIIHRDFIVMTIASTLLNILWNIYIVAKSIRGKGNSRPGYPVALVALAFYWVSQYLLLYLSRTREYFADEFAGQETGNPNALSMALIKIAYGLTKIERTPFQQKLLGGTRALGIADAKSSSGAGLAYGAMNAQQPAYAGAPYAGAPMDAAQPYPGQPYPAQPYAQPQAATPAVTWEGVRRIEKVMLFDLFNPWAKVSELSSTHPLTGRRIQELGRQAEARGQRPLLTFEQTDAAGQALDKSRLYGSFLFEVTIYFLPHIFAAMFVILSIGSLALGREMLGALFGGLIVFGIGLGMTIKGFYRFPSLGDPAPTTVLELMSDPYASPLRGRPVVLDGVVTGRASAGNKLGEDFMITDRSSGLMMINYESPLGGLGNWWFAIRRVGGLMNQNVRVLGWFRRGMSQQVDLKRLRAQDGSSVSSWTGFWGKCGGVVVLVIGLVLGAVAAAAAASNVSAPSSSVTTAATATAKPTATATPMATVTPAATATATATAKPTVKPAVTAKPAVPTAKKK